MPGVVGLYGHMRRNALKTALLMGTFMCLICVTWFAWCLIYTAIAEGRFHQSSLPNAEQAVTVTSIFMDAASLALERWWLPIFLSGCWFLVAFLAYADIIRLATRARPVERREAPRLYNIVENLAIAAGLPMPRLDIILTPQMNAFASGLSPDDACITVTSGLMYALSDDELEAVIAHEMTHIKNGDVQLMIVATVFAGGLTLVGDGIAKLISENRRARKEARQNGAGYGDTSASTEGGGGVAELVFSAEEAEPTAVLISFAIGVLFLAMAHVSALMVKFALSRAREFLADAGAVELTKNPDALIAALKIISGRDAIPNLHRTMMPLMISGPSEALFSTHPPIAARIAALEMYAGGRDWSGDQARRPVRQQSLGTTALTTPAGALGIVGGRATFGRRGLRPSSS